MKEYFAHDYNASSDIKMQILIEKHGLIAYGFYWILVEAMHQANGKITQGCTKRAARMHKVRTANAMLCTMLEVGLFVEENGLLTSNRLLQGLAERERISTVRKEAANTRYKSTANALQMQSKSRGIKEKESKVKEDKSALQKVLPFFDDLISESKHGTNQEFRTAWKAWVVSRQENRKPLKITSVGVQIKMLDKLTLSDAIKSIENSINFGYQGLFPPKHEKGVDPKTIQRTAPTGLPDEVVQISKRPPIDKEALAQLEQSFKQRTQHNAP